MRNKLKIALVLGGMIGTTYASDQPLFSEDGSERALTPLTNPLVLREIDPNILKKRELEAEIAELQEKAIGFEETLCSPYGKLLDLQLQLTKKLKLIRKELRGAMVELANVQLHLQLAATRDELERNNAQPNEPQRSTFKIADRVTYASPKHQRTGTTPDSAYKRDPESLKKEAQQNCLGKVTGIDFRLDAGSLQQVLMSPSPEDRSPQTPNSWERIVAEVEAKYATPAAPSAPRSTALEGTNDPFAGIDADSLMLPPSAQQESLDGASSEMCFSLSGDTHLGTPLPSPRQTGHRNFQRV